MPATAGRDVAVGKTLVESRRTFSPGTPCYEPVSFSPNISHLAWGSTPGSGPGRDGMLYMRLNSPGSALALDELFQSGASVAGCG